MHSGRTPEALAEELLGRNFEELEAAQAIFPTTAPLFEVAAGGEITVAEKASETSTAIETTRFRRADLREAQQCMYE